MLPSLSPTKRLRHTREASSLHHEECDGVLDLLSILSKDGLFIPILLDAFHVTRWFPYESSVCLVELNTAALAVFLFGLRLRTRLFGPCLSHVRNGVSDLLAVCIIQWISVSPLLNAS